MKRHLFVPTLLCASVTGCVESDRTSESIVGPIVEERTASHALGSGLWSVESIKAADAHACALEADGEAYCWGDNTFGQLGDGTISNRNVPARVAGGHVFEHIDALSAHTCALTREGAAYCWGGNRDGQLGDGTTTDRREPTPVAGGHTFKSISTGATMTCALDQEGEAWCWGSDEDGQLGKGTFDVDSHVPARVSGGRTFTSLESVGRTCALEADGTAYCWGWDGDQQRAHITPTLIPDGESLRFRHLVATGAVACGVGVDQLAYCWGGNDLETDLPLRTEPMLVDPDQRFTAVSDRGSPCGLGADGDIHCWAWRTFELTKVTSGGGIASFSGDAFSFFSDEDVFVENFCALDADGFAYCWGENDSGQIGDGTNVDRTEPTPVLVPRSSPGDPQGVTDLSATNIVTATSIDLVWRQVDDGTGEPAKYRLRYGPDLTRWRDGEIGCDRTIEGNEIGALIFCTVEGLEVDTRYEFQLMSFRTVHGVWVDARYSNLTAGKTGALAVSDLEVQFRTTSSTRIRWTQVDDGTGEPAYYRIKHASKIGDWREATITSGGSCRRTIEGTSIGVQMTCSFESGGPQFYEDGESFEIQLMSYRLEDGVWRDARYSNVAVAPPR